MAVIGRDSACKTLISSLHKTSLAFGLGMKGRDDGPSVHGIRQGPNPENVEIVRTDLASTFFTLARNGAKRKPYPPRFYAEITASVLVFGDHGWGTLLAFTNGRR